MIGPASAPPSRTKQADVVIVGGGPAGSALAGLLARLGVDTVVLDRSTFPRPKPCGECINPGGVAALDRLGLLRAVVERAPARISGWRITTESGAEARGRYSFGASHGLGMPRSVLDAALVSEVRRLGARVVEGMQVVKLAAGRSGRGESVRIDAVDRDGARVVWRSQIVVGADGLRSVVARRLGLVRRRPRIRKVSLTCRLRGTGPPRKTGSLFLTAWGTIGLAPVHASEPVWNGTVVAYTDRSGRAIAADPTAWFRGAFGRAPVEWDGDGPEIIDGPWASGPFDWPNRCTVSDRALLVGDAAGYFDPLTGQGIYRALRCAELAAPVIRRAVLSGRTTASDLFEYHRGLRRLLWPTRMLQRGIEAALSRSWPREIAIARLAVAEPVADVMVQVLGDTAPVRALANPALAVSLLRSARRRG